MIVAGSKPIRDLSRKFRPGYELQPSGNSKFSIRAPDGSLVREPGSNLALILPNSPSTYRVKGWEERLRKAGVLLESTPFDDLVREIRKAGFPTVIAGHDPRYAEIWKGSSKIVEFSEEEISDSRKKVIEKLIEAKILEYDPKLENQVRSAQKSRPEGIYEKLAEQKVVVGKLAQETQELIEELEIYLHEDDFREAALLAFHINAEKGKFPYGELTDIFTNEVLNTMLKKEGEILPQSKIDFWRLYLDYIRPAEKAQEKEETVTVMETSKKRKSRRSRCPYCGKEGSASNIHSHKIKEHGYVVQEMTDVERSCFNCGTVYKPSNKAQRFCSISCRNKFHYKKKLKLPLDPRGSLPIAYPTKSAENKAKIEEAIKAELNDLEARIKKLESEKEFYTSFYKMLKDKS